MAKGKKTIIKEIKKLDDEILLINGYRGHTIMMGGQLDLILFERLPDMIDVIGQAIVVLVIF